MRMQAEELAVSLRDFAQQQAQSPNGPASADCADIPLELLTPRRPPDPRAFPKTGRASPTMRFAKGELYHEDELKLSPAHAQEPCGHQATGGRRPFGR